MFFQKELIPVVQEIEYSSDELIQALLALPSSRGVCILDSCGARSPDARFLIAGFDPVEVVEAKRNLLYTNPQGVESSDSLAQIVTSILDQRLKVYSKPPLRMPGVTLPAYGACIATFAYELGREFEHLTRTSPRSLDDDEPLATLALFNSLVLHDYLTGRSYITSTVSQSHLEQRRIALANAVSSYLNSRESNVKRVEANAATEVTSNFSSGEYINAVLRVKEYIAAGDIYQANLTQQFNAVLPAGLSPEDVFVRLRQAHPASFAAFIRRGSDVIVSASPERFLRIEFEGDKRRIEAWPIKGTRPRGKSAEEDQRLREELSNSAKDRAENIMIVDLLRNDLGRVCEFGSVKVSELFAIQELPTMFHLVSKVQGLLRDEVTFGALLRATFPCGSITGAPKIRAMEIIDEIESSPRGLSMGAIGYFSFDGRLDLNVAIRTMTIRNGIARFNTGGGIVTDSDPEMEYQESLLKARALMSAVGVIDTA